MSAKDSSPILITGVGKRIGFALAQHFLIQEIPVIGTFRSEREELNDLKIMGADLYHCDFYDQQNVSSFIAQILAKYSSLRAVIHNASDWISESPELAAEEVMLKMMQVHVNAPYQINLAFETCLNNADSGMADIIHFTDYVVDTGSKKHIAYAASKAASANMVLSFAARFAPSIKVNAIAPALLLFNEHDSEEYKEKTLQKSLIEKEGGLQEVISTVEYLFNSTFITGRTLYLDGGRHLK